MGYKNIDELLSNKARLGIMTMLITLGKHGEVDFNFIRDSLKLTDGNLASHMKKLRDAEYIQVMKFNINKKSRTIYIATDKGKDAFETHANAIKKVIGGELY